MITRRTLLRTLAASPLAAAVLRDTETPRERLLAWIQSLQTRSTGRVLVGQEISAWSASTYDTFVAGLERAAGKRPAMVGVSIMQPGDYDTRTVDMLLDHHHRGGLVTISTHWTHPWGDYPDHGKYYVRSDTAPKPDLRQLLSTAPASAHRSKYWEQVADLVRVLDRFAAVGAVVLLRPFHEMNGPWFWWGHDTTTNQTALVELWQDLHRYLTARFDNLLWWYSAATSWNASIRHYFPGATYADFGGVDLYDDELKPYKPGHRPDADDWTEVRKLGLPGGLAEFGPAGDTYPRGAQVLLDRVRDTFTTAVFAHSWYSWQSNQQRALAELPDIRAVLADPVFLTLDEVHW